MQFQVGLFEMHSVFLIVFTDDPDTHTWYFVLVCRRNAEIKIKANLKKQGKIQINCPPNTGIKTTQMNK